jgi:hypothetical protein
MKTAKVLAGLGLGVCLFAIAPANANPITITLSEPTFATATFTSPTDSFVPVIGAYGTFLVNQISADDTGSLGLPLLLFANTLNVSGSTAGVLTINVTAQNLSAAGFAAFMSSFTSNGMSQGWSLTETTYVNAANTTALGSQLSTNTFTCPSGPCGSQAFNPPLAGGVPAGLFSATDQFVITATGAGAVQGTINLTAAVPETSTWAMMILGFMGVGFMAYRRRDKQTGFRFA